MSTVSNPDLQGLKLIKPNLFEDNRGFIQPLCDLNMKSASLIYTKSNQWRANHYHKKDWHFIYVIKGEFEYYFRKTNANEDTKKKIVTEGQSVYIPLGAVHRMQNPGKMPMVLIEVHTGAYLGEVDIIRYEDQYARS